MNTEVQDMTSKKNSRESEEESVVIVQESDTLHENNSDDISEKVKALSDDEKISEILEIPTTSEDILSEDSEQYSNESQENFDEKKLRQELGKLQDENNRLKEEQDILRDKHIRLAAEMDNYRKRTQRDLTNRVQNAFIELIRDFLPVLDDMDRSLNVKDENKDYDNLSNGVTLIHQKFVKVLDDRGVTVMDTVDSEFDPNLHEALTQMAIEDKPAGIVIEEHLKGYTFNNKILRPAKVVVSK